MWGDNSPQEPTGINFKAKTVIFKQAVANFKAVFRKGSTNYRNGITATVTSVENKSGASVTTVSIVDESGQTGTIQMKTWVPNKKSKVCTIQVENVKSEEVKFVKIFVEVFLKYGLEEALKRDNIKFLFRNKPTCPSRNEKQSQFKCDTCDSTFQGSIILNMHIKRMHTSMIIKQVQLRKSKAKTRCDHCGIPFSEESLNKHIETIHACTLCKVVSKTEIERKKTYEI